MNYPGNSILPKEEKEELRPKTEKVIVGGIRKPPLLDRIVRAETTRAIAEYVIWEVLVPAVKTALSDIVTNGMDIALYGADSSRARHTSSSRLRRDRDRTFVSYSDYYDRDKRRRDRPERERESLFAPRHRFEEIIYESRSDAEEVLSTLIELIDQYEIATVADLLDASGTSSQYTDRNYGWDSLNKAYVRPVRGGFIIELPKPILIE